MCTTTSSCAEKHHRLPSSRRRWCAQSGNQRDRAAAKLESFFINIIRTLSATTKRLARARDGMDPESRAPPAGRSDAARSARSLIGVCARACATKHAHRDLCTHTHTHTRARFLAATARARVASTLRSAKMRIACRGNSRRCRRRRLRVRSIINAVFCGVHSAACCCMRVPSATRRTRARI